MMKSAGAERDAPFRASGGKSAFSSFRGRYWILSWVALGCLLVISQMGALFGKRKGLLQRNRRSLFSVSSGMSFRRSSERYWTLYNKPWKTGSSSRSAQLNSCLLQGGYRVITFNWTDGSDVINPVSPILMLSKRDKMFSGNHGRFSLGELQNVKQTRLVEACYVTSIRDPVTRVPSHLLQLADGENVIDKKYKKSRKEIARMICSVVDEFPPQYMVHYMTGMHSDRHLPLSPNQTRFLAKEVLRTYDIVVDESGNILYDSGRFACSRTRECLRSNAMSLNVKIGDKALLLQCQEKVNKLVREEGIFYKEMVRLMKSGDVY